MLFFHRYLIASTIAIMAIAGTPFAGTRSSSLIPPIASAMGSDLTRAGTLEPSSLPAADIGSVKPGPGADWEETAGTSGSPEEHNNGPEDWRVPATAKAKPEASTDSKVWKSNQLNLLAIGMGIGDVTGSGKNEVVIVDPSAVNLYSVSGRELSLIARYETGSIECKSVDVARMRKQGPARIYVTAQNRAIVTSFVLEYRNGALVPVVRNFPYYLRVIVYPTKGPVLLGQQKGLTRIYDGPIVRLEDKGDELLVAGRFGVSLKMPIFGFAVGDFDGTRTPLIAVYDRSDHMRIYTPPGKRLFISKEYYGGSDVVLRRVGPEARNPEVGSRAEDTDLEFVRPRIMALDIDGKGVYDILAITHHSMTMRMMSRFKMLEEGQVVALRWNGDALEEKWRTPKIQGMITDFVVDSIPGIDGPALVTVERQKTDWFSFIKSTSLVRAYSLKDLVKRGVKKEAED